MRRTAAWKTAPQLRNCSKEVVRGRKREHIVFGEEGMSAVNTYFSKFVLVS